MDYIKLLCQIREQMKVQWAAKFGLYGRRGGRLKPSRSIWFCLLGCYEFVFRVSTGESLSPTQNLTTTRNPMSSVDVKRHFEAMSIKGCCEVSVQHNVFKFSGNYAETSHLRQLRSDQICLNLTAHHRI